MADNTKIWPIFRSANWGLSDDLFTGIKNSFYYSNNMEIREDSKSIYPKQSPRATKSFDLWQATWDWAVGRAVAARYFNSSRYVFTQKKVFILDTENNTATPIADWFTENLIDVELFAWYVYIATRTHLYRISQSAATADWATSTNFTDIALNSSSYHPLYATDVLMAVGNGSEVWKVTREIPDQVQTGMTLQSDYKVKFLNELWWFIRVTADDWYYWAEILLWDKVSAANEIIPMNWYKFLQSRIYNWYHYLLSDKWLWLMNWYQFYILKRIKDISTQDKIQNWMIVYDDKLYFVKSDWIYIYWAKNKNYTDVLNMWSATYSPESWLPNALATDWKDIVFTEISKYWGSENAHLWVHLYSEWYYRWQEWELQTMAYFGSSMSEIKQAMYLRVWYWISFGNIKIYYRTEADESNTSPDSWTWHELTPRWWLTKSSDMRSPFATSLKLNCRFQRIQFKFVLSQNMEWTLPYTKLYSADLYYNDMLD